MTLPRDNMTPDGQHVDFGLGDDVPMPRDFNAPDDGCFIPGAWGHVVPNDGELDE